MSSHGVGEAFSLERKDEFLRLLLLLLAVYMLQRAVDMLQRAWNDHW